MSKYVLKNEVEATQFDGKPVAGIEIDEEKKPDEAGRFFLREGKTKVTVLVGDYLVEKIGGGISVAPKAEFEAAFKPAPVAKKLVKEIVKDPEEMKKLEEALKNRDPEEEKADSERVANTKGHKQKK